ncbi:hypothetical protein GGR50DRAFT_288608 [Xylaria sp. CBS 124048]|nr:hypothetical protein GGR50DRAFT_288608 [Xylaria sp. CBS 124048]
MSLFGLKKRRNDDPWYRPKLKAANYAVVGDAYANHDEFAEKWAVDQSSPYLTWVKNLSKSEWIHLQPLADFMSIGTMPHHWPDLALDPPQLSASERASRKENQRERIERTNVRVLDYYPAEVKKTAYTSATALRESLGWAGGGHEEDPSLQFRLYVVEDLSRDVIEMLGTKFNVEPDFFRAQIADFAWYNVCDRWRIPPLLDITSRSQNWLQLRYVTARYFRSKESFQSSFKQADAFNVLRRVDDDLSNKSAWDEPDAIVGLTRSRAALWLQPEPILKEPRIGILLLDPTVKQGVPLWRGRRTLWPTPPYQSAGPEPPRQKDDFFEDFVFWAQQTNLYRNYDAECVSKAAIPLQVLLHLVTSEWLTMSDYIKTRLNQLDWEIIKPEFFRASQQGVNMLEKLHMWRRLVPLFREMVAEAIRQIDQFSPQIESSTTHFVSSSVPAMGEQPPQNRVQLSLIGHYQKDYLQVQSQLEEYQRRIDQLTSVVTAIMSIDTSQRGLQDNQNIGRLTWLATIFIPLSLIAGILSIQPDAREISRYSFMVYFATSLPLAVAIALVAVIISKHGT